MLPGAAQLAADGTTRTSGEAAERDEPIGQNGAGAPLFQWECSGHSLTSKDIERYSRQLILPTLGVQGASFHMFRTLHDILCSC